MNNVNIWLSHKVHQFRAVRTILRFLPTILFRNLNLSISFFLFYSTDSVIGWVGGEWWILFERDMHGEEKVSSTVLSFESMSVI